jgi:thiol-disulfide isomerase/thioredoxin
MTARNTCSWSSVAQRTLLRGVMIAVCMNLGPLAARPLAASATQPFGHVAANMPTQLPDLDLRAIDGRSIQLKGLRGKVVIVNFWATWCSPCRAEIPILIDLQRQFGSSLVIVGVSEDVVGAAPVRRFAETLKVNYPIVMSWPELAQLLARDQSLPVTQIFDRDGRLAHLHRGIIDRGRVSAELRALIGSGQPPPR